MAHIADFIQSNQNSITKKINLMENSLAAFSDIADVPVSFYSAEGKCMWIHNEDIKICSANDEYGQMQTPCTKSLSSAMNISLTLGEPYIFTCHSGLINICYALVIDEKILGFLIAGPMIMGTSRDKTVSGFSGKIRNDKIDYSKLFPIISRTRLFSPKDINSVSVLLMDIMTSSLETSRTSSRAYQQSQEQLHVSNRLIELKKSHLDVEYPYESEGKLIDAIKAGNSDGLKKLYYKYMEDVAVFEGGNLSLIKIRVISLISQLLRSSETLNNSYEHLFWLDEINQAATISNVIQYGFRLVSTLADILSQSRYSGNSEIIKKAVTHILENYSSNITLKTISASIHVNSTYLSVLFKKELGISAVEFIQNLRLSQAEKMLRETDMAISHISAECGFSSQSYFTKLFHEKNGLTPKEFRASRN